MLLDFCKSNNETCFFLRQRFDIFVETREVKSNPLIKPLNSRYHAFTPMILLVNTLCSLCFSVK